MVELIRLLITIFGDAGDIFKFLAMPMSPDIFEERANQILSAALRFSKLGAANRHGGPKCFLHCGWIEQGFQYGFHPLASMESLTDFAQNAHRMYLDILLTRHSTQVLQSTPLTPQGLSSSPQTIPSSPSSCVQLPGDVSPISLFSNSG